MNNEKRDIKLERNTKENKVTIKYERTIEIDSSDIPIKIKELKSLITQMEHHYHRLGADIESAKRELKLLTQLNEQS